MSFRILYYPFIDIPSESWIRRVLLYSDCIGSIVPGDLEGDFYRDTTIGILREYGEYEPFDPGKYIFDDVYGRKQFEAEVIAAFESNKCYHRNRHNFHLERTARVYESKFSYTIRSFFEDKGLLSRSPSGMLVMEELAAATYVGLLAKHIAVKKRYTPGTDNAIYESFVFSETDQEDKRHVANIKVLNCMPEPLASASIEDILDFKSRRRHELTRIQEVIADVQNRVSKSDNEAEINDILESFGRQLRIQVHELERLLKESKLAFRRSSLKMMLDSVINRETISRFTVNSLTTGALHAAAPGAIGALTSEFVSLWFRALNVKKTNNELQSSHPYSYVFQGIGSGLVSQRLF